jgi:carboxypeptidase C (cathepsin A)
MSDCKWSDESQAILSYNFLVKFFEQYPEYATQGFYLSGESYAGVLVPTLAMEILSARKHNNPAHAPWSVEGILLGNAVPGSRILTATPYSGWLGAQVAVDFRYGHGMISVSK